MWLHTDCLVQTKYLEALASSFGMNSVVWENAAMPSCCDLQKCFVANKTLLFHWHGDELMSEFPFLGELVP